MLWVLSLSQISRTMGNVPSCYNIRLISFHPERRRVRWGLRGQTGLVGHGKKSGYDSKYNHKWSEASAQESDMMSFTLLKNHSGCSWSKCDHSEWPKRPVRRLWLWSRLEITYKILIHTITFWMFFEGVATGFAGECHTHFLFCRVRTEEAYTRPKEHSITAFQVNVDDGCQSTEFWSGLDKGPEENRPGEGNSGKGRITFYNNDDSNGYNL